MEPVRAGQSAIRAGRPQAGRILQSSVDRFLAHNEGRVHRGAPFNRIADEGCTGIIRMRCSPQAGGRLAEIAARIAQESGRDGATMRHALKCFDTEDSDPAIFPHHRRTLGIRRRRRFTGSIAAGESVAALAQRFDQSRSRIYASSKTRMPHGSWSCRWTISATNSSAPVFGTEGTRDIEGVAGKCPAGEEAAGAGRSAGVSG